MTQLARRASLRVALVSSRRLRLPTPTAREWYGDVRLQDPRTSIRIITEIWHPVVALRGQRRGERTISAHLASNGVIREYQTMPNSERGEMVAILHCFPAKRE
jgi:hypothetical protein